MHFSSLWTSYNAAWILPHPISLLATFLVKVSVCTSGLGKSVFRPRLPILFGGSCRVSTAETHESISICLCTLYQLSGAGIHPYTFSLSLLHYSPLVRNATHLPSSSVRWEIAETGMPSGHQRIHQSGSVRPPGVEAGPVRRPQRHAQVQQHQLHGQERLEGQLVSVTKQM